MVAYCLEMCVNAACLKIEMCKFSQFTLKMLAASVCWETDGETQCLSVRRDMPEGMCGYVGCPFLGLSLMSHLHPWIQKENGLPSGVMRKALGDFPNIHPGLGTLKGTDTHASASLCFSFFYSNSCPHGRE